MEPLDHVDMEAIDISPRYITSPINKIRCMDGIYHITYHVM